MKPASRWRLYATWEPRPEPPETSIDRLLILFSTLRATSERRWTAALGKSTRPHPCEDRAGIEWALRAGSYPVEERPRRGDFVCQNFYLGTFRRWEVKLTIACGAQEKLGGVETPNRLEITGTVEREPQALRELLVVVIAAFRPTWAFVARGDTPKFPVPGLTVPTVGWVTYLSASFGQIPPAPCLSAVSVPQFGTLVQTAKDGAWLEESSAASLRAVSRALKDNGVFGRAQ
ncbi:MAG: hypothetical protein U0271_21270 [Polyangiaceae bacterium]